MASRLDEMEAIRAEPEEFIASILRDKLMQPTIGHYDGITGHIFLLMVLDAQNGTNHIETLQNYTETVKECADVTLNAIETVRQSSASLAVDIVGESAMLSQIERLEEFRTNERKIQEARNRYREGMTRRGKRASESTNS